MQDLAIDTINVQLFGTLTLIQNGQALLLPPAGKPSGLLSYLLLNPDKQLGRSHLVDLFWQNVSEQAGRKRLSQTLWHIRRTLPQLPLEANAEHVWIESNSPTKARLVIDSVQFLQHLKRASDLTGQPEQLATRLQKAQAYYRGPLLDHHYEEWVLEARQRFETAFVNLLSERIELASRRGAYAEALELVKAQRALDNFNEDYVYMQLQLLVANQQRGQATAVYDAFESLIESELAVQPSAWLQTFAATLNSADSSPTIPTTLSQPSLPLIGRESQRSQVLQLFDRLSSQHEAAGHIVLVSGPSGVGKTRFVHELAQDARWRTIEVLHASCYAHGGEQPLGALLRALRQGLTQQRLVQLQVALQPLHQQALSSILPELVGHDSAESQVNPLPPKDERNRSLEALLKLLSVWASLTPTCIIIDDIQWADQELLWFTAQFAERLTRSGVFLLLSSHSDAVSLPSIRQIISTQQQLHLPLSPLSQSATAALTSHLLGATATKAVVQHVHTKTQGNPLFIQQMLQTMIEEGELTRANSGQWVRKDGAAGDDAVSEQMRQRVLQLDQAKRSLLETLAVFGRAVQFDWLLHDGLFAPSNLFHTLHALIQGEFLTEAHNSINFVHETMRDVVYAHTIPDERQRLHSLALSIVDVVLPDVPEQALFHALNSAAWLKAYELAERCARSSRAQFGYRVALSHYDTMLALLAEHRLFADSEQAHEQFRILDARRPLHSLLANREAAAAEIERLKQLASQLNNRQQAVSALIFEALYLYDIADHFPEAELVAEKAVTAAKSLGDDLLTISALNVLGRTQMAQNRYQEAIVALRQAVTRWEFHSVGSTMAQLKDSDGSMAMLHYNLAASYWRSGQLTQATEMAKRFQINADRAQDKYRQLYALSIQAILAGASGDNQQRLRLNEQALQLAEAIDLARMIATLSNNLAYAYLQIPDYARAQQLFERALATHEQQGSKSGIAIASSNLASVYVLTGQLAAAGERANRGVQLARELNMPLWESLLMCIQGDVVLFGGQRGRFQQAIGYYHAALERIGGEDAPFERSAALYSLGYAHWLQKEVQLAAGYFRQALPLAEQGGDPEGQLLAQSYLARCLALLNSAETALSLSTTCLALLDSLSGKADSPTIYLNHAETLLQNHAAAEAAVYFAKAKSAFDLQRRTLPAVRRIEQKFKRLPSSKAILRHSQITVGTSEVRAKQVQLARLDAGGRGLLKDKQSVTVTWQIPNTQQTGRSKKQARQLLLLSLIEQAHQQGGTPTTTQLAEALGVTRKTLQRDLDALRREGLSLTTRGSR